RLLNDIQRFLVEDTRLGIPAIVHEESVGGLCARDATVFPQAIGLAATWDPALVEAVAGVIREQMLAVGARHTLSPVLDVARDPRWGRVEETYGEDPYLAGVLGTAYVRGLQTDDLGGGVVCTGKHFLAYGLPEGGMNHAPVHVGPRELREVFAEPFAAAIRDAGLASVMNSYSSVDGLPCAGAAGRVYDTAEQRALARTVAARSCCLLTNSGVLPLGADRRTIAVVGPTADDPRLLQGDYHYPAHLEIMHLPAPAHFTPHVTP